MLGLLILCFAILGLPFSVPLRVRSDAFLSPRLLLPAFHWGPTRPFQQADEGARIPTVAHCALALSWLLRWPLSSQCCCALRDRGLRGPYCSFQKSQERPAPNIKAMNAKFLTYGTKHSGSAIGAAEQLPFSPNPPSLPECDLWHPLKCTRVFEAARRWINASRPLREAVTAEARLRMLMQLAAEGPAHEGPSKLAELPPHSGIQRAVGIGAAASAALEAEPGQPETAFISPLSAGVTLLDAWRPVSGCAAAATVRVALQLPVKHQCNGISRSVEGCSMGSRRSSSLCCTAGELGAKVYVYGKSDSLVVGGLLQLLTRSLSGGPPCGAFFLASLGPSRLLRRCNVLDSLPDFRIRGFREAVELISQSTRELLLHWTRCEMVSTQGEGCPDSGGIGGRGPAEVSASPVTAGKAQTESPTTAAATATALVATASTPPPTGDLSDPFTLSLENTEAHLAQHGESAMLVEISRAALPLGGGVGSEVHVLVSGGVDSAVSLLLMREWGFRPKPVFLKVWAPEAAQMKGQLHTQHHNRTLSFAAAAAAAAASCPWREDAEAAASVAAAAGLPLEVLPMQQQYWDRVITTFVEGARAGLTLNPDWSCNSLVKFGAFVETLGDRDFHHVVSGHYARIQMDRGAPRLLRGRDLTKDQSYFLSGLSVHQLSRCLFPVGALMKTQVRKLAAEWNLPSSQRPDSQGLCFLGPLPVGQFLMHLLGEKEGPIFHFPSGALVGHHKGLWAFTAGQQKGVLPLLDPRLCRRCVGAAGGPPTLSGPWSVVGKVPEANALFVISKEEERAAEECVRNLSVAARSSRKCSGGSLLEAAAKTDRRALLALRLRQLRTCLRVENIRWFREEAPSEFAGSIAAPETSYRDSVAAAVAADAVAAASEGDPVLLGKPANGNSKKDANQNLRLVVQVRHSAGFHGVAKHKFKILWTSKCPSQGRLGRLSGDSSCSSASHNDAELLLEQPDVGLAPGQIAAFYRGDECVGSARISSLQGLPVLKAILGMAN